MKQSGFTLLELAIVLAIVGLIAGGVVVGANMIEAAENRSLMTDVEKYRTAMHTFKDKYGKPAGDLHNATRFWGKNNTICAGHTGTAATDGTCNGDGNGTMGRSNSTEVWYVWNHLSKAKMIEGDYAIYDYAGAAGDMIVGHHVPETSFSGASFEIENYEPAWINIIDWFYRGEYGHIFRFGIPNNPACPYCFNATYDLTADRMWSIDDKMDDGRPGTGLVRTTKPGDGTPISPSDTYCVDEADSTKPYDANYRVEAARTRCTPVFLVGF